MASQYEFTLEDLFQHANIEDVYEDGDGGGYEITFVMRNSKVRYSVVGETLPSAIESGIRIIDEQLTLSRLQSEGLNEDDIDRLSSRFEDGANEAIDQFAHPAQTWNRGYLAGLEDAARTIGTAVLSAAQRPAAGLAGEPEGPREESGIDSDVAVMGNGVNTEAALAKHPLLAVIYQPVGVVNIGG